MESDIENNIIAVKLESGDKIMESLNKIAAKYNIKSGFINSGIGMVKHLKIGYWNNDRYDEKEIEARSELVAFHGSIADSEYKFHIHIGVATPDHILAGGHFFDGIADPLMEIQITKLEKIKFGKKYHEESKLNELEIL